ncbi:MAG: TIGR00282 family metallophosphoesterase [Deltaproteobacteria bacterium]|nr:TIGR00282 family metallophosphoesterase [Deltaproteobacteria bacterium]
MRILILGDVVGQPGRRAVRDLVPMLVDRERIDLVIANAENAAGGMGVDVKSAEELFAGGVHVLTSGNHITHPALLRPANYPDGAPGRGWREWENEAGLRGLIINVQGRVFMPSHVGDPFRCVDGILRGLGGHSPVVIVDLHAEATSEKNAMGWFLDGRVSAVYGTHTHVQTADERILPKGTAYITDIGMCGPMDSVIGIDKEVVIEGFLSQLPCRFDVAKENVMLQGAVLEVDGTSGRALDIRRLRIPWQRREV